jgi:CO dehydrogenase maturation factor
MGGLSRDFLTRLKLEQKDVAVIDTEAGVEHLGRGVASSVDIILLVLDPSYESIRLSEKVATMAKEAGKSVYFVLNKMDKATADKVSAKIGKEYVVGFVPFTPDVQEKGLSGEELDATTADITDATNFVLNAMKGGNLTDG